MKKKQKTSRKRALFNASVILAGLRSPGGGSAKVLGWAGSGKIIGLASEVILDEAKKNLSRVGLTNKELENLKLNILPAPGAKSVDYFRKVVFDPGDAHVLASAREIKADYLVSLDRKHILVLKGKIKGLKIVSPGELIEELTHS